MIFLILFNEQTKAMVLIYVPKQHRTLRTGATDRQSPDHRLPLRYSEHVAEFWQARVRRRHSERTKRA